MSTQVTASIALLTTGLHNMKKKAHNSATNLSMAMIPGSERRHVMQHPYVDTNESDPNQKIIYPVPNYVWKDKMPRPITRTDNPLNISLKGDGFIELSNGNFTKNGQLAISREGVLETSWGVPLKNGEGGGDIVIDQNPSELKIMRDGSIFDGSGKRIAKLSLVAFDDDNSLRMADNNEMTTTSDPGHQDFDTRTLQGYLSTSNIQTQDVLAEAKTDQTHAIHGSTMIKALLKNDQTLPSLIVHAV